MADTVVGARIADEEGTTDQERTAERESRGREHPGAILARGALFNTIAFLASNLRGIFTFLVARLLGSAVLGTFGVAWAATDLISKLATCGFDTGAITWVARREAEADRAASRRIMRTTLTVALAVSGMFALIGFVAVPSFGARFGQRAELARAAAVMLLALPGITLYRVSNALSRGMGVMHHDIYSRGLTESLGTTAALLVALALGARTLAPEIAAIAGTAASGVVAFVVMRGLYATRSLQGPSGTLPDPAGTRRAPASTLPRMLRHSVPIAIYDLVNIAIMKVDVIMLGLFVGRVEGVTLETLGVYAAACEVAGGLRKVNQAFNPIFIPVVARQIGARAIDDAQKTYGYLARWMLAVLLPAVAVLALAGSAIMRIYGPSFARGGAWVAIVGAACALNAFVALGETILVVERPALNLFNSSTAFALSVALNLVLIPRFGALGAAIGMLVPYSVQGALRGVEITAIFKWRWPWRALAKPWIAAVAALPVPLAVRLWSGALGLQLAAAALFLTGYVIAWRIIGLDPHDRGVLDHLLHRR